MHKPIWRFHYFPLPFFARFAFLKSCDAISVFSTTHRVNHEFESSLSQDKRKAKFSGEIESGTKEMVAVYPYTSDAVYSDGKITGISIPTAQTATESSFANGASVTIAKATKEADAKTVQLAFHNGLINLLH